MDRRCHRPLRSRFLALKESTHLFDFEKIHLAFNKEDLMSDSAKYKNRECDVYAIRYITIERIWEYYLAKKRNVHG